MDEQNVRSKVRGWVTKRARKSLGKDFSDATPLLELGILSSLDVVEFVLFIESLRGEDVDPEHLQPESFTSIDTVYYTFFTAT